MPIYEYRRPDGTTFEVMQSFSDETLTHDPETGVEVRRVLHAPAVHFKGSGFYNTDYGTRRRQRESAASESSASGDSSSKEDSASSKNGDGDGGAKSDAKSADTSAKPSDSASKSKSKSEPVGA